MLSLVSGKGRVLRTDRLIAFLDQASPSTLEFLTRQHGHDLVDQVHEICMAGQTPALVLIDLTEELVFLFGSWSADAPGEPAAIETDATQTLTLDRTAEIALMRASDGDVLSDTYLWRGHVPAGGFVYRPDPGVDHRVSISWVDAEPPVEETLSASAHEPFESGIFDDPGLDLAQLGRGEIRTDESVPEKPPEPAPIPEPAITGPDREPPTKVINLTDPSAAPAAWQFREPPTTQPPGAEPSPTAAPTASPPVSSPIPSRPESNDRPFREPADAVVTSSPPQPSPSRLAVIDFGSLGQRTIGQGIIIGRNPTREPLAPGFEAIVIPDSEVSRAHAKIWISGSELVVQDLGSANGSMLHRVVGSRHDVPTAPDALTMLVGDELEIGSLRILFVGWDFNG